MSVGDARRRDNGLVAAAYVAAGDVDPRVGEHLLDVLALEGIAAYLRPSSDLHPVTRSTTLPKRPTDRLYVDREHVRTARDYLARLAREEREAEKNHQEPSRTVSPTEPSNEAEPASAPAPVAETPSDKPLTEKPLTEKPHAEKPHAEKPRGEKPLAEKPLAEAPSAEKPFTEPTNDEVDRAFAEIIAGYDRSAPARPAVPDTQTRVAPSVPDDEPTMQRPRRRKRAPEPVAPEPSLLDGLDTFGSDLPEEDEGSYVPPEAPPVPLPPLPVVLGVIGVVGGLVIFLKPSILAFLAPSLVMFLGFLAVVSGFGTLIWRLRPGGDDDEADPDDGARV